MRPNHDTRQREKPAPRSPPVQLGTRVRCASWCQSDLAHSAAYDCQARPPCGRRSGAFRPAGRSLCGIFAWGSDGMTLLQHLRNGASWESTRLGDCADARLRLT